MANADYIPNNDPGAAAAINAAADAIVLYDPGRAAEASKLKASMRNNQHVKIIRARFNCLLNNSNPRNMDEATKLLVGEAYVALENVTEGRRVGRPSLSGDGPAAQRMTVTLTTEQLESFYDACRRAGVNRSEAVREALALWLESGPTTGGSGEE